MLSVDVLPPDTPISLNPTIEFGGKFGILRTLRVPLVILLALIFGINVRLNTPLVVSILPLSIEPFEMSVFPITGSRSSLKVPLVILPVPKSGINAELKAPLAMSIFSLAIESVAINEFPITGSRATSNTPLVIWDVGISGMDVNAMFWLFMIPTSLFTEMSSSLLFGMLLGIRFRENGFPVVSMRSTLNTPVVMLLASKLFRFTLTSMSPLPINPVLRL